MDIQKLKLVGFIGPKVGLGLDEITIDYSGLAGLITFFAPTGGAKTTCLENSQPHAEVFSRENNALKDQVLKDCRKALKQFSFRYRGDLIETEVPIDGQTGRMEAFAYVNGAPVVKGKITEYRAWLESLIGRKDVFLAGPMCVQNATRINSMQQSKIKDLMQAFLHGDLSYFQRKEESCAQAAKIRAEQKLILARDIEHQQQVVMDNEGAVPLLAKAEVGLKDAVRSIGMLQVGIDNAEQAVSIAQAAKAKADAAAEQIKDAEQAVAAAARARGELEAERDKALDVLRDKARTIKGDLRAAQQDASGVDIARDAGRRAEAMEIDISELRYVLPGLVDAHEKAREDLRAIDKTCQQIKTAKTTAEKALEDLTAHGRLLANPIQRDIAEAQRALGALDNDRVRAELDREIAHAERLAEGVSYISPNCTLEQCEGCRYIADAKAAHDKLPGLRKRRHDRANAIIHERHDLEEQAAGKTAELERQTAQTAAQQQKFIEEIQSLKVGLDGFLGDLEGAGKAEIEASTARLNAQTRINGFEEVLKDLRVKTAALPALEAAAARAAELQKTYDQQVSEGALAAAGWKQRIEESRQAEADAAQRLRAARLAADPHAAAQVTAAEQALTAAREAMAAHDRRITELRAEIKSLTAQARKRQAADDRLQAMLSRMSALNREITAIAYVRNACARDGIPAIITANAMPMIVETANLLLESSMGVSERVGIETLDENGKEIMRPYTLTSDGRQVASGNRSGGQQTYDLKPFRLGMVKLAMEKSGIEYKTAWFDEDDKGLDGEIAKDYTAMYRGFHRITGVSRVLTITHFPQCAAMSDHVLGLVPGVGVEEITGANLRDWLRGLKRAA